MVGGFDVHHEHVLLWNPLTGVHLDLCVHPRETEQESVLRNVGVHLTLFQNASELLGQGKFARQIGLLVGHLQQRYGDGQQDEQRTYPKRSEQQQNPNRYRDQGKPGLTRLTVLGRKKVRCGVHVATNDLIDWETEIPLAGHHVHTKLLSEAGE